MKFVLYSNKNYEYQIQNFLYSYEYANLENEIIYFTIDFDSNLRHKKLINIRCPKLNHLPNFLLYKPTICLEALKIFNDDFCFFDTDVILSKRFSNFNFVLEDDYPICCLSPINYPYSYRYDYKGEMTIQNEVKLMKYFNIEKRSMDYIYSCFFSFNYKSKDFLEEWQSLCNNLYFLKNVKELMPFGDETALNVLYWKKNINKNYGHKFINTHKYSTFELCENDENKILNTSIDNNIYEYCENSNQIYFYHGYKGLDAKIDFKL